MFVAIDIDGTLFSQEARGDIEALVRLADYLRARDMDTVLATGRSLEGILELKDILQPLDVKAVVANSGAEVFWCTESGFERAEEFERRSAIEITLEQRRNFCDIFLRHGLVWLQETRHQFPSKLSFYVKPGGIPWLRAKIAEARATFEGFEFLISYNASGRDYHYFDIHPSGATKLSGLRFLAERWSMSSSDVVYFGDNGNDLPCFREFEHSYVVPTYIAELKQDAVDIDWRRMSVLAQAGPAGILAGLQEFRI